MLTKTSIFMRSLYFYICLIGEWFFFIARFFFLLLFTNLLLFKFCGRRPVKCLIFVFSLFLQALEALNKIIKILEILIVIIFIALGERKGNTAIVLPNKWSCQNVTVFCYEIGWRICNILNSLTNYPKVRSG